MIVTYPVDPHSWGESLAPLEGTWISLTGCGSVSLDLLVKVFGDVSIRHATDKCPDYYGALGFELTDGKEFDATQPNAKIHFYHILQNNVGFTGLCSIALQDISGNRAIHGFGTAPNGVPEEKNWNVGPTATEWVFDGPFDWSKVKSIAVQCEFSGVVQGPSFWVDSPHFSYEAEEGILRVESIPTGQTGTITVPDGTYNIITPSEIRRIVGTEATVSISATDFQQWEDGSTNPVRTIIINLGLTTIIAYYETAHLPLLRIFSYDKNMDSFPASQGVKLIYKGIEQYVNVPFASRVGTGSYTLVAEETGDRSFKFWKKPDGTTSTEKHITIDVQTDTMVEVHWEKLGLNWLIWLIPIGIVGGLIFTIYLIDRR